MTILPSPVPHPLDLMPWELPGWVYEGLEWVIGVEWPEGDERKVWDLADQWFSAASALVGPRDDAFAAAGEVLSGYGNTGAVGRAFDEAWRRVAAGDDAPLIVLLAVSHELGKLVEEVGCDIEAAKIEVWIQVGILVVELLAMAVAVALTLGAASPAAGAAMAATRIAIQQIFKRLIGQLAKKALKEGVKEAAEKAAKEVSERGLKKFAKKAAREGLEEAAEEIGTDLGTQLYQNTTGRRDGLDVASLGASALGGFAGGAGASLAGLGGHASSRAGRFGENLGREMGGEVLGETAASLATGSGLPGYDDLARAATSGASSSTVSQTTHTLDHSLDSQLNALSELPPPTSLSVQPPAATGGLVTDAPIAVEPHLPAATPSTSTSSAEPSPVSATPATTTYAGSTYAGPAVTEPTQPDDGAGPTESARPGSSPTGPTLPVRSDVGLAGVTATADTSISTVDPSTAMAAGATSTTTAGATPTPPAGVSAPGDHSSGPYDRATLNPAPGGATAAVPVTAPAAPSAAGTSGPAAPAAPASATGPSAFPSATTHPSALSSPSPNPSPVVNARPSISDVLRPDLSPGANPAPSTSRPPADESGAAPPADDRPPVVAAPTPRLVAIQQGLDRRGYRDYARSQREQYEQRRREDEATRLRAAAEVHENRARSYAARAIQLDQAGQRDLATQWSGAADAEAKRCYALQDQAYAVLDGTLSPRQVDIGNDADFDRINDDVGHLADGPVLTGDRSALTGSDHPPSIDQTRSYGSRGGLRRPLALHQTDLERHMPRDANGNLVRTADPRQGRWFRLANDGGSRADPARSINCLDCSLSFFETWVHGRPRVSAPRTFDGYSAGNINFPVDGEADGPGRVEDITGGRFQQLCPDVRHQPPTAAQQVVQAAYADLQAQLLAGGHGSYAFVVNAWEGGASHAWVAINQDGTILYLDPQSGRISENTPLYPHHGRAYAGNVTSFDALVLDSNANPMPLPNRPPGMFTARPPLPPPAPTPGPALAHDATYLSRTHLIDGPPAVAVAGPVRARVPANLPSEGPPSGPQAAGRAPAGAAPTPQPEPSVPPREMLRDPAPEELQALGVGRATFADLGLDPDTLTPSERDGLAAALKRTALISPEEIRFTQRSVSRATSDGITSEDLVGNLRRDGWRGGPLHGVRWGDGSFASLDNRRLRAARRAGLDAVPLVVHSPSDRLADWPDEWSPKRRRKSALGVDIMELADGSWVVGGDEGRVVYAKGTIPQTYGEIALFRAAEQRSLLPGHLFGADIEPVLLGRPPDPLRPVKLSEEDQRVLDDLRLRATAAADRVQEDLAAVGQAVTAELGLAEPVELRGLEHRIKSAKSLAREYDDEARAAAIDVGEFASKVHDVLRFSFVIPGGARYRPALERVFAELEVRRYRIHPGSWENFWSGGNRSYGFNCTITSPDGQVFELQMPTERSWRAGKLTRESNEILRREDELVPRRVHALMRMLEINKRLDLAGAISGDLDDVCAAKDVTFARWILDNRVAWQEYKAWLDLNGRSFAEITSEFGLAAADFPVSAEVAGEMEDADVRLLLDLPDRRADYAQGDFRGGDRRGCDALGSPGEGMGLRSGTGGSVSG